MEDMFRWIKEFGFAGAAFYMMFRIESAINKLRDVTRDLYHRMTGGPPSAA